MIRSCRPDDLKGLEEIEISFVRRPRRIRTSVPDPAWEVTVGADNRRATAGCRVWNGSGDSGVTTVRHFLPAGNILGSNVVVDGCDGTVIAEDSISDSVFIYLDHEPVLVRHRGNNGWLKGVAPRMGEDAVFVGATSAMIETAVQGIDPGVNRLSRHRQTRIYTPAVTNPGDSGAALIEKSTDSIMGFAFERTAASEKLEWSSWIWADSVFTALNVYPQ